MPAEHRERQPNSAAWVRVEIPPLRAEPRGLCPELSCWKLGLIHVVSGVHDIVYDEAADDSRWMWHLVIQLEGGSLPTAIQQKIALRAFGMFDALRDPITDDAECVHYWKPWAPEGS